MDKKDENINGLIKEMMQLIASDTFSFEVDPNAELPEHIKAFFGLNVDGVNNNLYTGYTLKFGVMGKKNTEEMNKRLEKLYDVLSELRKEILYGTEEV